jgi:hypothetical protein
MDPAVGAAIGVVGTLAGTWLGSRLQRKAAERRDDLHRREQLVMAARVVTVELEANKAVIETALQSGKWDTAVHRLETRSWDAQAWILAAVLEGQDYAGLEMLSRALKGINRVIEQAIRTFPNAPEIALGSMPGHTADSLRQVIGEIEERADRLAAYTE